jgi:hypothetical protein
MPPISRGSTLARRSCDPVPDILPELSGTRHRPFVHERSSEIVEIEIADKRTGKRLAPAVRSTDPTRADDVLAAERMAFARENLSR